MKTKLLHDIAHTRHGINTILNLNPCASGGMLAILRVRLARLELELKGQS